MRYLLDGRKLLLLAFAGLTVLAVTLVMALAALPVGNLRGCLRCDGS